MHPCMTELHAPHKQGRTARSAQTGADSAGRPSNMPRRLAPQLSHAADSPAFRRLRLGAAVLALAGLALAPSLAGLPLAPSSAGSTAAPALPDFLAACLAAPDCAPSGSFCRSGTNAVVCGAAPPAPITAPAPVHASCVPCYRFMPRHSVSGWRERCLLHHIAMAGSYGPSCSCAGVNRHSRRNIKHT